MHPVHEYRKEVDDLKAEVAELKARLGIKPAEAAPPLDPRLVGAPPAAFIDLTGILRTGRGDVIVAAALPSYEARQAAIRAEAEVKRKGEWAAMTAGLPEGFYRDGCGMPRRIRDGKPAMAVDLEDAQLSAVQRLQANAHRTWKDDQGIPVHPLPVDIGIEGEG
jgi:hypothetical protein